MIQKVVLFYIYIYIKESGLAYDGAHIYTEACPWC